MALIRSTADIAKKWASVTPARSEEYSKGVSAPLKDWEKETEAANESWKSGVQGAIGRNGFAKGVKKVGTAKWSKRAKEVGTIRWPQGVSVAQPDYEAGFAPYRDEIEKTVLPPKGPKGDPRNFARVEAIGKALHAKKLSLLK